MKQVKQSDNTGSVGYRNIWGRFTLLELTIIKDMMPECSLCSTQYTMMYDVNTIKGLHQYINAMNKEHRYKPDDWGYYIEYHASQHDKFWTMLTTWLPAKLNNIDSISIQ